MMKTLIAAFTLAILFGSPALVQLANAAPPMDDARMKALQECGAMEKKYTQETWGVQQLDTALSIQRKMVKPYVAAASTNADAA
jgi:hypothetical protein